jgi:hypothetical protein
MRDAAPPPGYVFSVGEMQISGLEIYVFDVAHSEDPFPGRLDWAEGETTGRLIVFDHDRAADLLTEAANSADEDRHLTDQAAIVRGLSTLAARVRRAGVRNR